MTEKRIALYFDGVKKTYSSFIFPGGEIQVRGDIRQDNDVSMPLAKWNSLCQPNVVDISACITNANDIMEVFLLTDAVRQFFHSDYCEKKSYFRLTMHYLPYGRQDRVCAEGEALSLKVFASLVNAMKYDRVTIYDAHSDVALALFDNIDHVEIGDLLCHQNFIWENTVLVSPDNGAKKKLYSLAKRFNLPLILGDKIRDVKTGNITGTKVDFCEQTFSEGQRFLIVDDICDGGRTFIELAKKIRETYPNSQIDLYVTNGIFSKGFEDFKGIIDYVYCAFTFLNQKILPANVTVI